jgi:anti-anti-sigma factor
MADTGPTGFSIATQDGADGKLRVVVRGELDLATAPELEQTLLAPIEDGREVVLDLRELEFMDSSGVRVLVVAHSRAQGRFGLIAAPDNSPVTKILAIAGLAPELNFVDE